MVSNISQRNTTVFHDALSNELRVLGNDNIVLEEEQFETFGSKKNCLVVFRQISLNLLLIRLSVTMLLLLNI